jgi:hypothetical protein
MPKHTQAEMEQMSFEDLKKHAAVEAEPPKEEEPPVTPETDAEPEVFLASVEIDLEDGSGVQVFEAEGTSEAEAQKNLNDKLVEAQRNATKKIREQGTRLRELEAANKKPETPQIKELSPDDEFVITQELQKTPSKAFRKMFKQFTGYEPEEFSTVKQAFDAFKRGQDAATVSSAAVSAFLASHPDYEDEGKEGEKNTRLMKMQFKEMGIEWPPKSSDELTKAYLKLKDSGLLILRTEGAHSDTNGNGDGKQRIAEPPPEPTPQRTKKVTSIGTQNRTTVTPANTEPSEDDAYNMPLEKLRNLANKQLAAR